MGACMNESFSVGEVAIIRDYDWIEPGYRGMECTILSPLEWCWAYGTDSPSPAVYTQGHDVKCANGVVTWCQPLALRKKQPPQTREPTCSWEDVPFFNPTKVTV